MSKLLMDVKSYADLLNSVGQQGQGPNIKRPLSPLRCAELIHRLQQEEGESLDKISARLSLGKPQNTSNMYKKRDTSQVSMFLNLLKVSPKSQGLAGWNTDPYPSIPFSTIAQLATKRLTLDDQDLIIQSTFDSEKKRVLGKEDVIKIKKWLNENPDLPVAECIKKVLNLKPKNITTHMVVIEIHDKLKQFVESNADYEKKLLSVLQEFLPGQFYEINAGKSAMAISMDEDAYKIFYEQQYRNGSSYTKFIDSFLEDKIV